MIGTVGMWAYCNRRITVSVFNYENKDYILYMNAYTLFWNLVYFLFENALLH